MDIILDTNILRKDIKLKSKDFEVLIDYIKRTDSKIILSELVIKEISNLYRKMMSEKVEESRIRISKLNSLLINSQIPLLPEINLDKEVEEYINFLKEKLNIKQANILPIENDFLPDLVERAVLKRKPLGNDGQQFRDGILWLSTLKYANSTSDRKVVLITENTSDFCGHDKTSLDKDLILETKHNNVEVIYFKNISEFIEQHSSIIEFINDKWINENVDKNILANLFWGLLDTSEGNIVDSVTLEYDETATGHIDRSDYIDFSKEKYFIYEKEDGTFLLNIKFVISQEFLVEVEKQIEIDHSSYEYSYNYNPLTDNFDMETEFVPRISYDHYYDFKGQEELFIVDYILTIKDQRIINYEIKQINLK